MVLDLPELAEEWDEITDAERASWSLDWDQVIASDLFVLQKLQREGRFSTEQESRYRDVLSLLNQASPLIDRLGLYPPGLILEDSNQAASKNREE
jgi:hypothetical protein